MTQQTAEDRYGKLEIDDGRAVVRYTRRLAFPQRSVWQALTEDEHLAAWFPSTIDGDRAAGAPLTFRFLNVDVPPMTGSMIAFEPPSVMEFTWAEDVVRFELEPDGAARTVLTLIVTMAELGKAARDGAGWHISLDQLAFMLAGEDQARPGHGDRWRELNSSYTAQFGPEAAVIGPPREWLETHGES
ncbi:MAG TPA: SRPBCC domain-containing protein [Streptosporangiaceae bacterium]|jgi:uncharacterized protein YndB with AHSA1/START domain